MMGTSQRPTSETIERLKARVAPRVFAMRAQEEPDPVDAVRGIFSPYNILVYVLIDPVYEMKENKCSSSIIYTG